MSTPEGAAGAPSHFALSPEQFSILMTQLTQTVCDLFEKTSKNLIRNEVTALMQIKNLRVQSPSDFSLPPEEESRVLSPLISVSETSESVISDEEMAESDDSSNTIGSRKRAGSDQDVPFTQALTRKKRRSKPQSNPPIAPKTQISSSRVSKQNPESKPISKGKLSPTAPKQPLSPSGSSQKKPSVSAENSIKLPPPICVKPANWKHISSRMALLNIHFIKAKTVREFIRVQTPDPPAFRSLVKLLDELKFEYVSFPLEEDRQVRAVIRGVPIDIDTEDVKQDLIDQGLDVIKVIRMKSFHSKVIFPLVHVTLSHGQNAIFKISNVIGLAVKVEVPYRSGIVSQCHNCQDFYHTQCHCKLAPKCVKCGEAHISSSCSKDSNSPAVCANCGGPHTASYRGCPKFPKPRKVSKPNQTVPSSQPLPKPGDFPLARKSRSPTSSQPQPQSQTPPAASFSNALKLKPLDKAQKCIKFFEMFEAVKGNPEAIKILETFSLCM